MFELCHIRLAVNQRGGIQTGNVFGTVDIDHLMSQKKRNIKVIQTLRDIAHQTGGTGQNFNDRLNLDTAPAHTARHNKTDVAGTDDDCTFSRDDTFDIEQFLGGTGSPDTGGTAPGDRQIAAAALAAADRHDDCFNGKQRHTAFTGEQFQIKSAVVVALDGADSGAETEFGIGGNGQSFGFRSKFGAGQLFFEAVQTETVVDALVEDTAGAAFAVDDDGGAAALHRLFGGEKSGGTGADNGYIALNIFNHDQFPFTSRSPSFPASR